MCRRQNSSNAIHKLKRILLRPKVNIEGMELVVVFVLVSRIVGGEVPFFVMNGFGDGQGYHAVLLV